MYAYMYTCVYIYIERERERATETFPHQFLLSDDPRAETLRSRFVFKLAPGDLKIYQRGMQWKQGIAVHVIL